MSTRQKLVMLFIALILGLVLANAAIAEEAPLPDITVTFFQVPAQASTRQKIEISWIVKNQGNGDAVITSQWNLSDYGWYL
ncbi:MAG: hypothetical protein ABIH91_00145, partial [Candidatus Omnitrophota bacterium]